MFKVYRRIPASIAVAVAVVGSPSIAGRVASAGDFVTTVTSTRPLAYFRLDATSGTSQVGAAQYKASGGVTVAGPGAPIGPANFVKLDGRDGYILTTQAGGVSSAASMMAWVNLAALPSEERRFFYVLGESQVGNDLDVQFENDNVLKFYTAAGGHLDYTPAPTTLVNQWHLVVVTMDTPSETRAIYWDGKVVATDKGGGRANKTGTFSIGASTVFGGRFFKGGIQEAALWSRALKADEVAAIYAVARPTASVPGAAASNTAASATGPFATTAIVKVEDGSGPIALKREEQIALMFLTAIQNIESDCQRRAKGACSLDQVLAGPTATDGSHIDRLKFDPKTDPNYAYTLAVSGTAWEAHANGKKPGLGGFYFFSKRFGTTDAYYSPAGAATAMDKELTSRSIEGDSFATR